ncbi:hypothetical protein HOC80_04690 [archaeon]|nr:hypothetical protein [archaeon]MBT4417371.1 hypothetical protein [archaeon]
MFDGNIIHTWKSSNFTESIHSSCEVSSTTLYCESERFVTIPSEILEYVSEYVAMFKSYNVELLNDKATRKMISNGPKIKMSEDILFLIINWKFLIQMYRSFVKGFNLGLSMKTS